MFPPGTLGAWPLLNIGLQDIPFGAWVPIWISDRDSGCRIDETDHLHIAPAKNGTYV